MDGAMNAELYRVYGRSDRKEQYYAKMVASYINIISTNRNLGDSARW